MIQNNEELVQQLLDDGAYANETDNQRWTPLHCAAAMGHDALVEPLVQCHANLAAQDNVRGQGVGRGFGRRPGCWDSGVAARLDTLWPCPGLVIPNFFSLRITC